jgi:ubiquinol-cytochrome c reductase iron-sulfur subunit
LSVPEIASVSQEKLPVGNFAAGRYQAAQRSGIFALAGSFVRTDLRPAAATTSSFSASSRKGKDMASTTETHAGVGEGPRRRDFIHIATVSFAGVGAASVVIPLVSQMAPSADVLALSSSEIDISAIQPGQAIKTTWRKQPVFVRNLTPAEIAEANKVAASDLRDVQTLAERTKPGKENWLITLGVCTHLGCVPLGAAEGEAKGDFGGYFCPCHGSHYDTAGRIRKGPAPTNLVVPPYEFTSDTVVMIG